MASPNDQPKVRRFIWPLTIVAVLVGIVIASFSLTGKSQDPAEVVAFVNGEPIERTELIDRLVEREGHSILGVLIREKVVEQVAHDANVNVSQERVEEEFSAIRARFESDHAFETALVNAGQSQDSLRRDIRLELVLVELVADEISVSEEEIRAAYDQNREQLGEIPYEQAKERLERALYNQKLDTAVQKWITQQMAESKVETYL